VTTAQSDRTTTRLLNVATTDTTRSEVRQFLGALLVLAFVLSTFGVRDGGTMAFSVDIVLVLCGAWCANQLIRGPLIFQAQVGCVLRAYLVGLLCCSVLIFIVGWLVFLPSEFLNLGIGLLLAGTFTTNIGIALFPVESALRFDGVLDHLWVPALIAQCVLIVAVLYWTMRQNTTRLLLVLGLIAVASLGVSGSNSEIVQLLPIGGLWAFLFGAIPFLASNRYPILHYALLLGIITLLAGVLTVTSTGDTLAARALMVLGISFLYVGSRSQSSAAAETGHRRRLFGIALHLFLWTVPLWQITSALNISDPTHTELGALIMPAMFLSVVSWSVWQWLEKRPLFNWTTPALATGLVLLASGTISLSNEATHLRFADNAEAYLRALGTGNSDADCAVRTGGPLAGLRVCEIGPKGAPTVLIWGDHQLAAMKVGYAEAARRSGVSALLIARANCIPLDGLQTRLTQVSGPTEIRCEQHSAQILQALPHLKSIKQVTLVADWLYYTGVSSTEYRKQVPIRLGPTDGSPLNLDYQPDYVATAVDRTIKVLTSEGLRVSILRQVPAHPQFDAEMAARANAPGGRLYYSAPLMTSAISLEDAASRNLDVDQMFRRLSATGRMTYVNTWPTFCSNTRCFVRGGLSSNYVTSTLLTQSGALALADTLEQDLKRSRTHIAQQHSFGS
jgi:hypothetical protein